MGTETRSRCMFANAVLLHFFLFSTFNTTNGYVEIGPHDPRHKQCQNLHGSTARSCSSHMYMLNMKGNLLQGNCGCVSSKKQLKCKQQDALCGTLHCTIPGVRDTNHKHFKTRMNRDYVWAARASSGIDFNGDICFVVTMLGFNPNSTRYTPGYVRVGTPCGTSTSSETHLRFSKRCADAPAFTCSINGNMGSEMSSPRSFGFRAKLKNGRQSSDSSGSLPRVSLHCAILITIFSFQK